MDTDIARLVSRLREHRVIAIEGFMGSGKTTLAEQLAQELGLPILSSDEYALDTPPTAGDVPTYNERLRADELRAEFDRLCGENGVIVEGICLRMCIELSHDVLCVYVKRLSETGIWQDMETLLRTLDTKEPVGWLDGDTYNYHIKHRPHELADYIYQWRESEPT